MKKNSLLYKKVNICIYCILIFIFLTACGSKSTSKNQESTKNTNASEKQTVSTKEITVKTVDGQALTFDVNEVETSVDNNGNTVYKLDDGTSVTLSKEGTAIVETKNEDGTTTVTKSESVTIAPVIKEVESTSNDDNKPNAQATTVASNKNTQGSTEGRTEAPTNSPTQPPTVAPTQAPTESPTVAPTEAPTEKPTVAPTEAPTEPPTPAPTEAPTEPPTPAPTEAPTETPTVPPTQWTLDVDSYMAQMESNLRAAGKVTIKEYLISQGVPAEDLANEKGDCGSGYVPLYIHQSNYQYILNSIAKDNSVAYYLEYMGRDGIDYVIRVYYI